MSVTTGFIQIHQVNQTQQIPQFQQIVGSWRIPRSVVVWGSVVLSPKASSSSFFRIRRTCCTPKSIPGSKEESLTQLTGAITSGFF